MDEDGRLEGHDEGSLTERAEVREAVTHAALFYWLALLGAREAAEGEKEDESDVQARGVLSAVIFSTLTLEAYPSDLLIGIDAGRSWATGLSVSLLASVYAAQKRKEPLEEAYARAATDPQDKAEWYRRTRCLRMLRNEWVHFETTFTPQGVWPRKLSTANCAEIITGRPDDARYHWTTEVLRAGVAEWACHTACMAIEALHRFIGGYSPWNQSAPGGNRFRDRA